MSETAARQRRTTGSSTEPSESVGNPPPQNAAATPTSEGEDSLSCETGPLDMPLQFERGTAAQVANAWNEMAKTAGLPQIARLTDERRKLILARLRDVNGSLEQMRLVFAKVAASPRLRGERNGPGHKNWRADFDFILNERNFTRLLEGIFDDHQNGDGATPVGTAASKDDGPPPGFRPYIDPRALAEFGDGADAGGAVETERVVPRR